MVMVIDMVMNNLYNNFIFFHFILIFINYLIFIINSSMILNVKIFIFSVREYVKYYVQEGTSRQVDF